MGKQRISDATEGPGGRFDRVVLMNSGWDLVPMPPCEPPARSPLRLTDNSSITQAFFDRQADQTADELAHETTFERSDELAGGADGALDGGRAAEAPAVLARRGRLTYLVAALVTCCSLLCAPAAVDALTAARGSKQAEGAGSTAVTSWQRPSSAPVSPGAGVTLSPPVAAQQAAALPLAGLQLAARQIAEPQPSQQPDALRAKGLAARALRALEAGRPEAAIEAASAAIEADPADADPYVTWGAALLDQGKRAAAKEVFGRCVERATRGRRYECRQFR